MEKISVKIKKKLAFCLVFTLLSGLFLIGRLIYIEVFKAGFLQPLAYEQQSRDRLISPVRGSILDRNNVGIAVTESVCSVSAVPVQVKEKEKTAQYLSEVLELDYNETLDKLNENVALVRLKSKIDVQTAQEIREKDLDGINVDEDVKRVYPFKNLASKVIGFAGKDNQGVTGLESKYDEYLSGSPGKILTVTDSQGVQISDEQTRIAPENGNNLVTTIDASVQRYAEQTISKAVEAKGAKRGIIIVLNPQNGEIYAMAEYPNFDLNEPFEINDPELKAIWGTLSSEEKTDALNQMWRNTAINDTYEPGSTFKIVTSSAGLEEKAVSVDDTFVCNGYYIAGDRQIKCWRYPRTHGQETFVQGVLNSCNPVFMAVAQRLGAETFYNYMVKFGFTQKTGVDLPGEAVGIIHKLENIGPVELATMSFGQSFQITPLQLLRAASAIVNGGNLITPHFAKAITEEDGNVIKEFEYPLGEQVISKETSDTMRGILEKVVAEGTGNKAYIPGYRMGGKTATSEKLPRKSGKYIASFMSFAPAENPQVMAFVLIDEPQGVYYGGTVAGPVMKELMSNILPYFGIEPGYNESESELDEAKTSVVPDITGLDVQEAKKLISDAGLTYFISGEGNTVLNQFPLGGAEVNYKSEIILTTGN